jgi:hypothetical protein
MTKCIARWLWRSVSGFMIMWYILYYLDSESIMSNVRFKPEKWTWMIELCIGTRCLGQERQSQVASSSGVYMEIPVCISISMIWPRVDLRLLLCDSLEDSVATPSWQLSTKAHGAINTSLCKPCGETCISYLQSGESSGIGDPMQNPLSPALSTLYT